MVFLPYVSARFWYAVVSLIFAISSIFPMTGYGLGPGG